MNFLSDSLSPYLLQHKGNPVQWYPWGEAAFAKARETDRPIFLSVGYAACHWCHVMEHESFENEQIADFLNANFVSIKVDREERPDIDQIYMNAVQVMTGRGGWPMSVFLDHDQKPFYAGTYWPPHEKFGMPGFAGVLDALAAAWKNRRHEIGKHAGEITVALQQLSVGTLQQSPDVPDASIIHGATDHLLQVLDRQDGGFGAAPKFPHVTDLDLLIRRGFVGQRKELIDAAELTLDRMADGGIRDHIGGGFARYSVDAKWLVPHFEKMLYDNALLAEVYVRAFQVTGHDRHAQVATEVLDYLCRDMVDDAGGFHCSEDADSEGVEGKFYVWTPDQVAAALGGQRADRFCRIYDITTTGNFEGQNIPHLSRSIDHWADDLSIASATLRSELNGDRARLLQARDERVRPGRDDKVLASWNALAVRALSVAGAVLNQTRYIEAAERAAQFMVSELLQPEGRLLHAFRRGAAHVDGFVDDYALTIDAFLALFEAGGEAKWVDRAVELADFMLDRFEDPHDGGFYYVGNGAERLITRNKDWHDGSLVSGNAAAAMSLTKLSRLCDRDDYRAAAERTFRAGQEVLVKQSAACGALLSALDRYWGDGEQWVLAVNDTAAMTHARPGFLKHYRPHATLSWVIGRQPQGQTVVKLNQQRSPIDGQPTLYRCQNFTCDLPITGDEAMAWLDGPRLP